MLLPDGYHDLPPGKLAAVVTFLEMRGPAPARTTADDASRRVRHVPRPTLGWYRNLYRAVGEEWLWASRLVLPDAELAGILASPEVEVHLLEIDGAESGILELDFRVAGACEITFFGVVPAQVGRGHGRWLMDHAVAHAFARPIDRLWLHTCSLDAPEALRFYRRAGFVPYAQQVEVFDDPRLLGALPRTAAPQVPLFDP